MIERQVDSTLCDYLEYIDYKYQASLSILSYLLKYFPKENEWIKEYTKISEQYFIELELTKKNIAEQTIPELQGKDYYYKINYFTQTLTCKKKESDE